MHRRDRLIDASITRRAALVAIAQTGAWLAFAGAAAARPDARAPASWPDIAVPDQPRFEDFHRLSRFLTARDDIDRAMSRAIYEHVMVEPWGPQHLTRVYDRLRRVSGAGGEYADVLDPNRFEPGERWFVSHLLVTWYTGAYYHDTGNHAVGYAHALVHHGLADVRPIPTYCAGAYGDWSQPPAGIAVSR